ncbi:hypothetical protein ACQVP2_25020 [Methylobacterium aquaticum]|uniref:Uncharacterized protein n=1 Tax=Methylobacterium aquaticum TaxID=270351 RepID=A0A0J6SYQ5_9HYPH|nr:hypothetical protein [Methylobacterium aquaticum]KMO38737.1 hypothetical protein VP06_05725 [Methylobacterium aquaticum]
MLILASAAWPGLLAALVIGTATGFWAGPPAGRGPRLAAGFLALLAVATIATALAGVVPGREGFWVESAALMLTAYLAGCGLGGFGKERRTGS